MKGYSRFRGYHQRQKGEGGAMQKLVTLGLLGKKITLKQNKCNLRDNKKV